MERFYESTYIAEAYARFRPSYPEEILQSVLNYCSRSKTEGIKFDLLVDVGSGNGQACKLFQPYFEKLIGIDISSEQLKWATNINNYANIVFQEGDALNIPVPDGSADLVISGMAAHWFDLPEFFQEVKRVLKPDGCVAIFGYLLCKASLISSSNDDLAKESSLSLNKIFLRGLPDDPKERQYCLRPSKRYAEIYDAMPFEKERNDDIHKLIRCSATELSGMVKSINCYETYMEKKIAEMKKNNQPITKESLDAIDMATEVVRYMKNTWGVGEKVSDEEKVFELDFTYFLLLGRC